MVTSSSSSWMTIAVGWRGGMMWVGIGAHRGGSWCPTTVPSVIRTGRRRLHPLLTMMVVASSITVMWTVATVVVIVRIPIVFRTSMVRPIVGAMIHRRTVATIGMTIVVSVMVMRRRYRRSYGGPRMWSLVIVIGRSCSLVKDELSGRTTVIVMRVWIEVRLFDMRTVTLEGRVSLGIHSKDRLETWRDDQFHIVRYRCSCCCGIRLDLALFLWRPTSRI